jgi:iron complex transport system substrate-binding protein
MGVVDEVVLAADPDVILTSVNYIENPVTEIMSRPGWSSMTAVINSDVYFIDTDASNRPSHNIVIALMEMARAVYPELYR